jgi:hypothetical protein
MPLFFVMALFLWPFVSPEIFSFVIIQVILTLVVNVITDDDYGRRDFWTKFFSWGIAGLIPWGIALLVLSANYPEIDKPGLEKKSVLAHTEKILSLGLESGVEGKFSLGFGRINSVPFHVAHRRTPDKGFEVLYIKGASTLYEDIVPPHEPYYETYTIQGRDTRHNVPHWVRYIIKERELSSWREIDSLNKIHIPPHTVKREFSSR